MNISSTPTPKIPRFRFPEFRDEWESHRLGDCIYYKNGQSFESEVTSGGKYFLITLNSIDITGNLQKNHKRITYTDGSLRRGDLVMVLSDVAHGNFLGLTDIIPSDNYVLNQRMGGLRLKENVDSRFLRTYINNNQKYFKLHGQGSSQLNLTKSDVLKFVVNAPSRKEQKRIAEFLTTVDDRITELQKKKELLQKYKKGIMQAIFSQKIRFKNENGKDYPDWEEKRLGDADVLISDGNYGEMYPKASEMQSMGIPFIRANNIKNSQLTWDDMKYIDATLHSVLTSGHLEGGDILITTRGEIGLIAYVTDDFRGSNINAQICRLRAGDSLSSRFLFQYLETRSSKSQFKQLQTGSALKQLPKGKLRLVRLALPSKNEQKKVADFLTAVDDKINLAERKLEQAKKFKKALLQQLFV